MPVGPTGFTPHGIPSEKREAFHRERLNGIPWSLHGVFIFSPRGMKIPRSMSHEIPWSLHGKFHVFPHGIPWGIKPVPLFRRIADV